MANKTDGGSTLAQDLSFTPDERAELDRANTIHSQRLKSPSMWAIVHTLAKNGVRSATYRAA